MSQFLYSLITLLSISYFSFAESSIEANLKKLNLKNQIRFTIGTVTDAARFKKMGSMDQMSVDSDLSAFKVTRVSDAFMSEDGKYILTFVKDSENKIKRVFFIHEGGRSINAADDVIDVQAGEIKTSKGSVSAEIGSLIN